MSKHTINNLAGTGRDHFNEGRKNLAVTKNPRYIYTEEEPVRSSHETSSVASYFRGTQDKRHSKPWTNMLRTKWS